MGLLLNSQVDAYQKLAVKILELLNQKSYKYDLIREILLLIKEFTGIEALGIRLNKSLDFPYYETIGFPENFVESERYLYAHDKDGELIRDSYGTPFLECICGNVISGGLNSSLPFLTQGGSFWTNSLSELRFSTSNFCAHSLEKGRRLFYRNRCRQEGYESMALIPLRSEEKPIGLMQLNDKRKDIFTIEMIRFFEGIGASIGIALHHKESFEKLEESHSRLQETIAKLKETQRQVTQQERLHALGEMASGIAHDFNNSLASILGFGELLLRKPENLDDHGKVKRSLNAIVTAAKDAANVVRRMREFYRPKEESEIFGPVDLNRIVEEVILLTEPRWKNEALGRGINIDIRKFIEKTELVSGDEGELKQVLTNLIINAIDAMPQGGSITIKTESVSNFLRLCVSDTGTGMTEEIKARCFDPFFTTKGKKGTGLGLSIVYGIIRRHNGTINITSEMNKGTSFTIYLPIYVSSQKGIYSPKNKESFCGRLHILVVDDEQMIREAIGECLASLGHKVETAGNGREGLEIFLNSRFDLVITDRGMPEMSGDHMAMAIKKLAQSKPIIMLTGFGDMMEAYGETPYGIDLILKKPVTLSELEQAVIKVMRKKPNEKDTCS